jgi:hypothetical protein
MAGRIAMIYGADRPKLDTRLTLPAIRARDDDAIMHHEVVDDI